MPKVIKNLNETRVIVKTPKGFANAIYASTTGEVRTKTDHFMSFAIKTDNVAKAMSMVKKDIENKTGISVQVEEDKLQTIYKPIILNNEDEIHVPKFVWNIFKWFKKKDKPLTPPTIPFPNSNEIISISPELYNIIQSGFLDAWKNGFNGSGVIAGVNDTGCGPNGYITYDSNLNTVGFDEPVFESDNDNNGHGTHVAGTICSRITHPKKIIGGAWGANLKIYKSGNGSFYTSDLIQAIEESVKHGVKVLNNSWGGQYSNFMQETITRAFNDGTIIVKALGNENVECPDAYKDCVLVSAYTKANNPAKFSNWAPQNRILNSIAAYGVDILSTLPNNKTAFMSGTSMASPLVTAAITILLQKYPTLSSKEIVSTLLNKCSIPIEDKKYGVGLLNISKIF